MGVGCVRRFTVGLSRAQCLLCVVGCPEVLETSPHWRRFLLYVASHGALRGVPPSSALMRTAGASGEEEADDWETALEAWASADVAQPSCSSSDGARPCQNPT